MGFHFSTLVLHIRGIALTWNQWKRWGHCHNQSWDCNRILHAPILVWQKMLLLHWLSLNVQFSTELVFGQLMPAAFECYHPNALTHALHLFVVESLQLPWSDQPEVLPHTVLVVVGWPMAPAILRPGIKVRTRVGQSSLMFELLPVHGSFSMPTITLNILAYSNTSSILTHLTTFNTIPFMFTNIIFLFSFF